MDLKVTIWFWLHEETVDVDRRPDAVGQVDVDAARMCPWMPTAGVFRRCGRWRQAGAGVAGVSAAPGSAGTASVSAPHGMNCHGLLAMLSAFCCTDRQLQTRLETMPGRRDISRTVMPDTDAPATTAAFS